MPFAYLGYSRKPQECIRFPGAGILVVPSHLMRKVGTKSGYPTAEVLRQLSITQICHCILKMTHDFYLLSLGGDENPCYMVFE